MRESTEQQEDLMSIADVGRNIEGRKKLIHILRLFSFGANGLVVDASRPNYDDIESVRVASKVEYSSCNMDVSDDEFSFFFECYEKISSPEILHLLLLAWFEYEHLVILFRIRNEMWSVESESIPRFGDRERWNSIIQNVVGYVLFRGAEDDVVWIGKSSKLEFPDIGWI